MLTIIGLGYGGEGGLTLGALTKLKTGDVVFLRTGECSVAGFLAEMGVRFRTMDDLYGSAEDFDRLNQAIAERVLQKTDGDVVYAVPGAGNASDSSVAALMTAAENAGLPVESISGISYADAALAAARLNEAKNCRILSCSDAAQVYLDSRSVNIITEIHSRAAASELKLRLMEILSDEAEIVFLSASDGETLTARRIRLYELDQQERYDHLTGVVTLPIKELTALEHFDFLHLVDLMDLLRAPGGCPWDREQTHDSIKQCLIEEAYESVEAIEDDDPDKLADELGDVLLQVVFHSAIAADRGEFTWRDVTEAVCRKMILRHTHIFGSDKAQTADDVRRNWEKVKNENAHETVAQAMERTRKGLPSLMGATKVQNKAALVGFDFADAADAFLRIREESDETAAVLRTGDAAALADELGDLLFSVVNVARLSGVQAEIALQKATDKFIRRFRYIEDHVTGSGKRWEDFTPAELDVLWQEAKKA